MIVKTKEGGIVFGIKGRQNIHNPIFSDGIVNVLCMTKLGKIEYWNCFKTGALGWVEIPLEEPIIDKDIKDI